MLRSSLVERYRNYIVFSFVGKSLFFFNCDCKMGKKKLMMVAIL